MLYSKPQSQPPSHHLFYNYGIAFSSNIFLINLLWFFLSPLENNLQGSLSRKSSWLVPPQTKQPPETKNKTMTHQEKKSIWHMGNFIVNAC
jgi:hypothetical protein